MLHQQRGRRRMGLRVTAAALSAAATSALCVVGVATPGLASASRAAPARHDSAAGSCHLANGIKHVVQIGFDNVHFFRDNPNVPSDLEMMPNLLHFIEDNGTLLTNNHTPLIAHTADDLLTTATGLYGDRHGNAGRNSYQTYNADGTTDPASSFAYWTDPIYDTASHPERRPRHQPEPGLLAHAAGHRRTRRSRRTPITPGARGCRTPGPAATSARSPRSTRSWRTPRRTLPRCSARTRPRSRS